jgi:5'-3' exonuclease
MKESSPTLGAYFPADFEIDMAGKRREWEGIVLLPKIDKDLFFSELAAVMPTVDPRDLSRNKPGKIFSYSHIKESRFVFKSYYGDITENYCNRRFVDF